MYTGPPEVNIRANSEQFESDTVTLVLEWTQESSLLSYSYNVSAVPDPQPAITFIGNTSVQLTVPYNMLFNVSVTASESLCGQKHVTTEITLLYSELF